MTFDIPPLSGKNPMNNWRILFIEEIKESKTYSIQIDTHGIHNIYIYLYSH